MQKTKTSLYENRKTLKHKDLKMQHFTSLLYKEKHNISFPSFENLSAENTKAQHRPSSWSPSQWSLSTWLSSPWSLLHRGPPLIVIRLLRDNYSLPLFGCLLHYSVPLVVVGTLLVMVRL